MENRQGIAGMRLASAGRALERGSALLCAVLMLCVLPLLFHNAFFDINRIKVQAVCTAVPPLALAFLVGHLLQGKKRIEVRGGRAVLAAALIELSSLSALWATGIPLNAAAGMMLAAAAIVLSL